MNRASRGALVISIDTELAWGRIESKDRVHFYPQFNMVREIVPAILELCEEFELPATWAIVGAMCRSPGLDGWPDIGEVRSDLSWERLERDDCLSGSGGSFVEGVDILRRIEGSRVPHEIASHSFGHPIFTDISEDVASRDFRAMDAIATMCGLSFRTFVYPRNAVGHVSLLTPFGYVAYRGPDDTWYARFPEIVRRWARVVEAFAGGAPRTPIPRATDGLLEIPGSLPFWIVSRGVRKRAPVGVLVRRAKAGIDGAIRSGGVCHLWFHPFNFAFRRADHLDAFRLVAEYASCHREAGDLIVGTMATMAEVFGSGRT